MGEIYEVVVFTASLSKVRCWLRTPSRPSQADTPGIAMALLALVRGSGFGYFGHTQGCETPIVQRELLQSQGKLCQGKKEAHRSATGQSIRSRTLHRPVTESISSSRISRNLDGRCPNRSSSIIRLLPISSIRTTPSRCLPGSTILTIRNSPTSVLSLRTWARWTTYEAY